MLSGSLYTWKLVSALWRANCIIMPQFLSDISLAILYWHFLCWHLLKYYPHIYLYLCYKIMKLIWSLIFLCWSPAFKSSLLSCVLGSVLLWILGVYVCMSNAKVVFTGDVPIQFFLPDPDSEMWTCVNWLQVLQCLNQAELNQCIHRCAGVTIWFQHFFFGQNQTYFQHWYQNNPSIYCQLSGVVSYASQENNVYIFKQTVMLINKTCDVALFNSCCLLIAATAANCISDGI